MESLALLVPILMLGGMIYIMYRFTRMMIRPHERQAEYLEELVKETRRHNEHMERLLATTNERLAGIEGREGARGS